MEKKRSIASMARYLLADGFSVREVAKSLHCDPRHVRWARAQGRKPTSKYARIESELASLSHAFLVVKHQLVERGYLEIAEAEKPLLQFVAGLDISRRTRE